MERRSQEVYVKAPARLHFGLIELRGDLGRIFGSVGLTLSSPNLVLRTSLSKDLEITGSINQRIQKMVGRFLRHYNLRRACRIEVKRSIPAHVGLGSGTQIALAVAKSLSIIFGIDAELDELAVAMGRASISSIGLSAFEKGGFIIDAGYKFDGTGKMKVKRCAPAPIVFRHPFPEGWLFVVAIPSVSSGLSGEKEKRAFKRLPKVSEEHMGRMYRVLYGQMVPSLIEEDIQTFGRALTQIQILTGKCFEYVQGGIYSSPAAEACIDFMLERGAYGAGQSSWGPTTYGLVESQQKGQRLAAQLQAFLERKMGGVVFLASANNRGALVRNFLS